MKKLSIKDFAESFGVELDQIPSECKDILEFNGALFDYYFLEGAEKDTAILEAIKRIDNDTQIIGAPERTQIWEKGWNENLENFKKSNFDTDSLIPKFYREDVPLRWKQQFIKSPNARFEWDFYRVFRTWMFKTYLNEYENIYEFGCGSGHNLVALAEMYPGKKIYGMDFVPSTIELVDLIREKAHYNVHGKLFNMLEPDHDFKLEKSSAVITIGVIEQLASKFEKFIDFIMENKPEICIHMEPTIEVYDTDNLVDYLSYKFHKKRGYTMGLLPYIQKLHDEKQVELLKVKRMYFGNLNMEGYTLIIWKPL